MGKTLVVGGLIPNWEDAILVLFDIKWIVIGLNMFYIYFPQILFRIWLIV
jgi:hypothetical protein